MEWNWEPAVLVTIVTGLLVFAAGIGAMDAKLKQLRKEVDELTKNVDYLLGRSRDAEDDGR